MHGRILIKIISASDLFSKDQNDLPSPYCKLVFGKYNVATTKSCLDTVNPVWNEVFHFPINKLSDLLEIRVNNAKNSKKLLGVYILSTEETKLNSNVEKTYILQKKDKKDAVSGRITLKIVYLPSEKSSTLQVQVLEAMDLKCKKPTQSYAVLKYGSQKLKSSLSKESTFNPNWNETFSITLWGPHRFKIMVVKKNRSVIGHATINLSDYKDRFDKSFSIPIHKRKKLKGEIKLKLFYKGTLGELLSEYSDGSSNDIESSFDISIDSSDFSQSYESSITDSSASSISDKIDDKSSSKMIHVTIDKAQSIHGDTKQEFYFSCSTRDSMFISHPEHVENNLINWDESFMSYLSSPTDLMYIKFFNKKNKHIGTTQIMLDNYQFDNTFKWLDVIPNDSSCDISKIYARLSAFPQEEESEIKDINFDISVTVVSAINILNNMPILVKCMTTNNQVEKVSKTIRSNDTKLEIGETFILPIKNKNEEIVISMVKVSKSRPKLMGSCIIDARILNDTNNHYIDNWFTLQSKKKDESNQIRIRLKLRGHLNRNRLFNKYNISHDDSVTEKSADVVINLAIIGPSSSGKTSILSRYVDNVFCKTSLVTIIDFKKVTYNLDGQKILVIIKDTSGMERFADLNESYFRNVDGVFVVFDKCDYNSFNKAISSYKKSLESYEDASVILLGNKCEKVKKVKIDREVGEKFAENNNIKYMEVSAKENINVFEAFSDMIEDVYINKKNIPKKHQKDGIVSLDNETVNLKKCCTIL